MADGTRKVTIVSTTGKKLNTIETNSTEWGELKKTLTKEGYNLSATKHQIGKTKEKLEAEQDALPMEDFTLFITPTMTKSGFVSFSL